jgi:cytochrome c oxidase assembly protein subunit 15
MFTDERERRTAQLVAKLASVAAVLMLVVIASSAWLRLSQSGLGCSGWPACYGAFASAAGARPAAEAVYTAEMRAAHRLTASVAGIVIAVAAVLSLAGARRRRGVTMVVVALLAVTVFLALLGRYTAATNAPAITLGNMLGGMALLALAWTLRAQQTASTARHAANGLRRTALFVLLLVVAQIVTGGLVSAKFATLACTGFPDCNGAWWPANGSWAAFDPRDALAASGDVAQALRQTLHIAHRYGALVAGCAVLVLALLLWRSGGAQRAQAAGIGVLVLLQIALGVALIVTPPWLALTVAHDVVAALLLAAVAAVAAAMQPG